MQLKVKVVNYFSSRTDENLGLILRLLLTTLLLAVSPKLFANTVSPSEIPSQCIHLGTLFNYDYKTFRSQECYRKFENFRVTLGAAYNLCRKAHGHPEVVCERATHPIHRAWNEITNITNRVANTPRHFRSQLLQARQNISDDFILHCVRRDNDTRVSPEDFRQNLLASVEEFTPSDQVSTSSQRRRPADLPFAQSISPEVRIGIATLGGALLNRFRGGWMPTGSTQSARLITAALTSGLGYFSGGIDGAIAGGLSVVPVWFNGWGVNMDMGRSNGTYAGDFAAMTGRGVFQMSLASLYLGARGYNAWPLLASGASMGACYAGGWELNERYGFGNGRTGSFFDGATSVGEVCFGGVTQGVLSGVLLNGTTAP